MTDRSLSSRRKYAAMERGVDLSRWVSSDKRCGCPGCHPAGGYECLNTELRDERDRYRRALAEIRDIYTSTTQIKKVARDALDG